jgi:hypothetical protein
VSLRAAGEGARIELYACSLTWRAKSAPSSPEGELCVTALVELFR